MNAVALRIGADTAWLEAPTGAVALALGERGLVAGCFGGGFPDAAALEQGIAVVEDELMRHGRPAFADADWTITDAGLHAVAALADPASPVTLDLAQVERLFSRLAAMSEGSPASHQGLPRDAGFAARLLVLRELMHHWRIPAIRVRARHP